MCRERERERERERSPSERQEACKPLRTRVSTLRACKLLSISTCTLQSTMLCELSCFLPDPWALNSCVHTRLETNYGFTTV